MGTLTKVTFRKNGKAHRGLRAARLEGWSTVCAENNISIHSTPGDWLS